MVKAILYTRVSTERQEDGYGFDAQEADVRVAAKRFDLTPLNGVLRETASGKVADRPLLAEALALIERGDAEVLLVPREDRLARDLIIQEAILASVWKVGGRVFTPGGEVPRDDPDNPTLKFVRQVMGAVAELDAARIKANQRAGKRMKRARLGEAAFLGGRARYGWRVEGNLKTSRLVPYGPEQAVLRKVRELRKTKTLDEIARYLNAEHPLHTGGRWHRTSVLRLLQLAP